MKRKGRKRLWLRIAIAAPLLTIALALLCAWLILKGNLQEEQLGWMIGVIGGVCAFALSLHTAMTVPRKKLLWGMVTAISYGAMLMLGNLLFFGEGYGGLGGVLLPVLGSGTAASLLGALRNRKIA